MGRRTRLTLIDEGSAVKGTPPHIASSSSSSMRAAIAHGWAVGLLAYNAPTDAIEQSLLAIPGARRALVRTTTGAFARFLSPQLSPTGYPTMGVMAAEVHSTLDVSIWPGGAKATALRGRSSKRNPPFEASRSLPSSRS